MLFINTQNKDELIEITGNETKEIIRRSLKKYPFKKDQKKALCKYNKIIIDTGTSEFENDLSKDKYSLENTKIRTHWRRGHFRELPPLIPTRKKSKLVWIKPSLINASLKNEIINKSYQANTNN